jgi:hypothetical protein
MFECKKPVVVLEGCSRAVCLELLRKEVIQPHLPVQLPCYDLTPVMNHNLVTCR